MTNIQKAEKFLSKADPVMKTLIKTHGSCLLKPHENTFYVLCDSIISQQLSVKASATIVKRFCALFPQETPSAELLVSIPDEVLRGVGCSGAKGRYLKDLAAKFLDGTLEPENFQALDDEVLIETLVQVKGIGRWTAEMFLIFYLHRADILPLADLGLINAIQQHYGAIKPLTKAEIIELSQRWQPYCTVATWYLWRSLDPVVVQY